MQYLAAGLDAQHHSHAACIDPTLSGPPHPRGGLPAPVPRSLASLVRLVLSFLAAAAAVPTFLSPLAERWAYVTLGASSIITEEVSPIVGGFAAHQHHLGVKRVMLAIAVGSWAATTGLYALGRWRAAWVRERWRNEEGPMRKALGVVQRRPWHSAFVVRFAIGARVILPLVCGAAHVPVGIYLVGSAVSSVAWSILFTLCGWAFGEAAVAAIGHVRRYEDKIAIGIAVAIAVGFFLARRRARREAAHVIGGE